MVHRTVLRRLTGSRPVGLGVDLATNRPSIARPGFATWVVTDAPALGSWSAERASTASDGSTPSGWCLAWHPSWLGELDREHPAALAVPVWLRRGARRTLADAVRNERPGDREPVRVVHATLAAVVGASATGALGDARFVLAVDADLGTSVSLVEIGHDAVVERAAWGWPPADERCAPDPDRVARAVSSAIARWNGRVDLVLAITRGDVASGPLAFGRVRMIRCGRDVVARGAARLDARNGDRVVSCTAHGVAAEPMAVAAGARSGAWAIAPHTTLPVTSRLVFDLGDDDGAELVVEIYGADVDLPEATVRFVGRHGYDPLCELLVELDENDVVTVGPTALWCLADEPSAAMVSDRR